jgi:hypothetical protein
MEKIELPHRETITSSDTIIIDCTLLGTKIKELSNPKIVGWYRVGKDKFNCTRFGTYYKPNFIKRFFMRTLLDFYWEQDGK